MALRDLLVRFGIEVDGKEKLAAVDKSVNNLKKNFQDLGAFAKTAFALFVAGRVVRGIRDFIQDSVTMADALKHNAEALGVSTDELQKWQYVAGLMNVPVQQAMIGVRFFNRAVGEAAYGTKSAAQAFGRLGMKITDAHGKLKPTDQLLFEFADHLHAIPNQAQRTAIAMRTLGRGGAALLPVLQNGSQALRDMLKDVDELGGGFDEDVIEKAHEVDRQQKRLTMGWLTMRGALLKELLPVLARFAERGIRTVKSLIDLAKNTYFVRTALVALGATVAAVLGAITIAFFVANPALAVITLGFVALGAALYVVYGILDDVYTFMQGGDSMLGRMLDQLGGTGTALQFWKDLNAAVDLVKQAFFGASDGAASLGRMLSNALVAALPDIVKFGGKFFTGVIELIDTAITGLRQLWQLLVMTGKVTMGGEWDASEIEKTNAAWEARMKTLRGVNQALDDMGKPRPAGADPLGARNPNADPSPIMNQVEQNPDRTSTWAPPPVTQTITTNVTVVGGPTNADTGRAVGKAVKDAASQNRDTHYAVTMGMPF